MHRKITLSQIDLICPLAVPNQNSAIFNEHTKFGENPLRFTQVIVQKQK